MPLRRKQLKENEVIWEQRIKEWQESSLSQSRYCKQYGISSSAFSKWKTKLHPKLKGRPKKYKVKSKYRKFSKLNDQQIETLIAALLDGMTMKAASDRAGVDIKTANKFYAELSLAILDGALLYPQLFMGAGVITSLGPAYDIDWQQDFIKKSFPCLKTTRRFISDKQRLNSNIKTITQTLFFNSIYKWSLAEIFYIDQLAVQVFYGYIYASHHGLDRYGYQSKDYHKITREVSRTARTRSIWDYWARQQDKASLVLESVWYGLFFYRDMYKFGEEDAWKKQMFHDITWVLKQKPINEEIKPLSEYWNIYPSDNEIREAEKNILKAIARWQKFEKDKAVQS